MFGIPLLEEAVFIEPHLLGACCVTMKPGEVVVSPLERTKTFNVLKCTGPSLVISIGMFPTNKLKSRTLRTKTRTTRHPHLHHLLLNEIKWRNCHTTQMRQSGACYIIPEISRFYGKNLECGGAERHLRPRNISLAGGGRRLLRWIARGRAGPLPRG